MLHLPLFFLLIHLASLQMSSQTPAGPFGSKHAHSEQKVVFTSSPQQSPEKVNSDFELQLSDDWVMIG